MIFSSIMKFNLITAISFLMCLVTAAASNNIGYDAILAIVIAELVFAFSVGVVCIVFSFNLFRTLKESSEVSMSTGDLPPRGGKTSSQSNLNGAGDPYDYSTFHERETYSFGSEAEMDYEGRADGAAEPEEEAKDGDFSAVVSTFTSYLKFW